MGLNFEIGRKNNTVEEKYDFPVMVINPRNEQPKGVQKFEFNKAAVRELKLIAGQYVGLALTDNDELVVVNLDQNEASFSAKINKDFTFNSKKMFDKIIKFFELDDTNLNEMALSCYLDEEDDYYYASMSLIGDDLPEIEVKFPAFAGEPQTPTDFFSDNEEEDGEFILPECEVIVKNR
jgi:hypothetical protein